MMERKYVRLSHPDRYFYDPLLRLQGSEIKLLPDPPSLGIKDALNAGGLVIVPEPTVSPIVETPVLNKTVEPVKNTKPAPRKRGRPKKVKK